MERFYPIGTPGQPWTPQDRAAWLARQQVQRSYHDDVLSRLPKLAEATGAELLTYGALSYDAERYPLRAVRIARAKAAPWVLITGGVHGYETSGVHGALEFLAERAPTAADRVNLLIAPCVSPWGYEVIHRWNPQAVDPNRSFVKHSESEEAASLMKLVEETSDAWWMHIDLHETTDTDESEFRPALAARDGKAFEPGTIPDGFYAVGDTADPQPRFQAAIIASVETVTHIAEPDENGQMIGCDVLQTGVILYPCKELGLCAGMTKATFRTTTEVYPDSDRATPAICNAAQVAAVMGGLEHALARVG